MGGCCCCFSSRRSEPIRTSNFCYRPRTSEEHQPLSAHRDGPSGSSAGLLVDTNLDTSNLDTYTTPPLPLPYDTDLGHPQLPPSGAGINYGTKTDTEVEKIDTCSAQVPNSVDSLENQEKEINCKEQSFLELTPSTNSGDLKKPIEPIFTTIEEEDCPICLEEYTEENPKMLTKCDHRFHLCCILEWMERSDTCPVCDQEVVIDDIIDD